MRCNAVGALYFTLIGVGGAVYLTTITAGATDAAVTAMVFAVIGLPMLVVGAFHCIAIWAPRKPWAGIWVVIQHVLMLVSCWWTLPALVALVGLSRPESRAWFAGEPLPEQKPGVKRVVVAALILAYWFVTVTGSFAVALQKLLAGPADDLERGGVARLVTDPYDVQHYSSTVGGPEELAATYLDGTPWTLTSSLPRPVAVLVWASWCPTCDEDMQRIGRSEIASRTGLYLVPLDCEANEDEVRADVERSGIEWPVLCSDGSGAVELVEQLPTMLIFDRQRRLRYVGDGHVSAAAVAEVLDVLEAEKR